MSAELEVVMLTLRQARKLETVPAVDVLVAGGGPARFSAGFAATRPFTGDHHEEHEGHEGSAHQ